MTTETKTTIDPNRTVTVEYSRMWNHYSVVVGQMSIIDTKDRGTAYQIYRNQTGSRLSLKEFIELVEIVN
tara:strand:+ start:92 stop:301 length:210 start_codon:yes stop_codon:yes gene_type:complete